MKKKVLLFSIITIVVISSFICITYYLKEQKIKEHEKIVENTKTKYNFYTENKINKKAKDKTTLIFNTIIEEADKNNNINFENFVNNTITDLNDNSSLINKIEEEQNNYHNSLDNLTFVNVLKTIDKKTDKKTLENIYNQNKFIQNIEEEKIKREEYLNNLSTLKEEITYFKENKELYTFENNTYFTKNEEVYNKLNEFKNKYNLDLNIKKQENTKVPILCYHGVLDEPWGLESLFVKIDEFASQMEYLAENGYTTLFVSEIKEADKYAKPIILTFDDGYKDVYTNAFPILKKYNLKANIYIISGWLDGQTYMSEDDLKEMANSSLIEVGSHTVTHQALAKLSNNRIEEEVKNSQEFLQKLTNKPIDVIAYPTGSYDERVIDSTKKYYKYALSTIKGKEDPANLNTYTLKRIYVYRKYNLNTFKNLF